MSELREHVEKFLDELRRRNASEHTVDGYGIDLHELAEHFENRRLGEIDMLALRGWLAGLHERGLAAVSIRRKLAAARSFFRFLNREKITAANPARLLRTPKAPKKLPQVMTAEQTNRLVDGVTGNSLERPFPERDAAIFEMLYGCGLRVSELTGLNLDDLDRDSGWIRVRGKGRKERQVPYGSAAAAAGER
jgi:integrase/recombinase XerC